MNVCLVTTMKKSSNFLGRKDHEKLKKKSWLNIMYIYKILYTMICNTHILNYTKLLYYDSIVLSNQIIVLYYIVDQFHVQFDLVWIMNPWNVNYVTVIVILLPSLVHLLFLLVFGYCSAAECRSCFPFFIILLLLYFELIFLSLI
jgi:hypothetical protein